MFWYHFKTSKLHEMHLPNAIVRSLITVKENKEAKTIITRPRTSTIYKAYTSLIMVKLVPIQRRYSIVEGCTLTAAVFVMWVLLGHVVVNLAATIARCLLRRKYWPCEGHWTDRQTDGHSKVQNITSPFEWAQILNSNTTKFVVEFSFAERYTIFTYS